MYHILSPKHQNQTHRNSPQKIKIPKKLDPAQRTPSAAARQAVASFFREQHFTQRDTGKKKKKEKKQQLFEGQPSNC